MPAFDPLIYRTDDLSKWGYGKGSILTKVEWDNNWWNHEYRITAMEDHAVAPIGIADFSVTGAQLTIIMDDASTRGPYTLPTSAWREKPDTAGLWAASTAFLKNEVFTEAGTIYATASDHTSGLTFDANAMDVDLNPLYLKIGYSHSNSTTDSSASIDVTNTKINQFIECTNAGGTTVTFTVTGLAGIPINAEGFFIQGIDDEPVAFAAEGGITIKHRVGRLALTAAQGSVVCWKKIGASTVRLFGDLDVGSV